MFKFQSQVLEFAVKKSSYKKVHLYKKINFFNCKTYRIGYVLYRGDKGMKSVDVICTPNESSKYEWRGTDGSSVECVKGNDD
jgi:hypothetical protein